MKKNTFTFLSSILLSVIIYSLAFAVPSEPPPTGKVWVEVKGEWILVITPPGVGPYIWRDGKWIIDPTISPSESEWIPGQWVDGHWAGKKWIPGHWVPGHWEVVSSPGPGAKWVSGHWKGDRWIPGHWAGSPPPGRHWVPGHRGPGGRWIPGHWK